MKMLAALVLAVSAVGMLSVRPRWNEVSGGSPKKLRRTAAKASEEGIENVPFLLELLGAALDAGVSVPRALQLVGSIAQGSIRDGLALVVAGLEIGATWEHAWERVDGHDGLAALHRGLSFAVATGAPTASLLYAEAGQMRRAVQRKAEQRAAALGVKLVLPLGLCALPAFICLGIVPVIVAMVPVL